MPLSLPLILKYTVLLSSIVLIALSITSFYLTGHVMKMLATSFPTDEYVWYGDSREVVIGLPPYHMVRLTYDWTTENLEFVSSGFAIVAGFLGVFVFGFGKWWREESTQSPSPLWTTLTVSFFALGALLTSLASFIFISVHRTQLQRTTCNHKAGEHSWTQFTCTRETAACDLLPYIVRREEDVRVAACDEAKMVRGLLVPYVVFALALTVALALVGVRQKRAADGASAEERVERLTRDEE